MAKKQAQERDKSMTTQESTMPVKISIGFSEAEISEIMNDFWEEISLFSYRHYKSHGRGIVVMDRAEDNDTHNIYYITLDKKQSQKADKDVVRLINDYDPEWEIVIQYQCLDNNTRTLRIRTAEGARHPFRIWLMEDIFGS